MPRSSPPSSGKPGSRSTKPVPKAAGKRAPRVPLTDAQRASVIAEYTENPGVARNEIARRTGVSRTAVTRIIKEHGEAFDRSQTVQAVQAREVDIADLKTQLALDMWHDAARLREQLWSPITYINYGGKEFDRVEDTVEKPIPADQLKIVQATAGAVQAAIKVDDVNAGVNVDTAVSMIGAMVQGLRGLVPDPDAQPSEDAGSSGEPENMA